MTLFITKQQWKDRFICHLVGKYGMSQEKAEELYCSGVGDVDSGYSPEWYARESLACNK